MHAKGQHEFCPSSATAANAQSGAVNPSRQTNPSTTNVVAAINDVHSDLKADIADLKTDVGKLLHHYGIVSGNTP